MDKKQLESCEGDVRGKLKLYGSRSQDELKSGDIDLCLIVETNQEAEDLQTKVIPFLMAVTKRIGDQKIDFAVISKQQSQTDPFWKMALVTCLDFWNLIMSLNRILIQMIEMKSYSQ